MNQSSANRKREELIDENIRRVFDETLQEGVPDRFRDLLAALKEQERAQGQK